MTTALMRRYIKRKQEQEAAAAAVKAEKTLKLKKEMSESEMLFGDIIQPIKPKKDRKPMSPRVFAGTDRGITIDRSTANGQADKGTGMEGYEAPASGMGVPDEAMGLLTGGAGLKDVGLLHEET
jgi:cyclin H